MHARFVDSMDPHFDRILSVMGSMAKFHPKMIVDSIMVWRKSKNDAMLENTSDLLPESLKKELLARNTALKGKDLEFLLRERRSVSDPYIFSLFLLDSLKLCSLSRTSDHSRSVNARESPR